MKKIVTFLVCLLPLFAFCGEPLMLIKPSREIFVNFPSAVLPDKAVSVFLPEPSIPLHQKYPVVYMLGVVPTDFAQAQNVLAKAGQKAIIVGINVTEEDLAATDKISRFFSQELVPYIDSNYLTKDQPAERVLAVKGAAGEKAAGVLVTQKKLMNRVVVLHGGENAPAWKSLPAQSRILVAGNQAEVAAWSQYLQENQKQVYGPGFVTRLTTENSLFDVLDLDYLFAPAEELELVKLTGTITPSSVSISTKEKAELKISALLVNGTRFDFVPVALKMAPPFLEWNSASGVLIPLPGATAGKVKISTIVDNTPFTGVLKLKK